MASVFKKDPAFENIPSIKAKTLRINLNPDIYGTFAEIGGHNLLEPAALSRPVIVGPHTFNAPDIAAQLVDAGAAVQLEDDRAVGAALVKWFGDPELVAGMGRAGLHSVQSGQGAVDRTLALIESVFTEAAG